MVDLQQGQAGTWYAIWQTSNGAYLSETGAIPDDAVLTANGQSKTILNHRPDPTVEQWNATTHNFETRVPPTTAFATPPASTSYKFLRYEVLDNPVGIRAYFYGNSQEISIVILDTEITSAATAVILRDTIVIPRLQRKLRGTSLATKLDTLVGQSVTI